MPIPEDIWKRAERDMARRRRLKLIRAKRIIPASRMPPQMMVKNDDGSWSPEIKIKEGIIGG